MHLALVGFWVRLDLGPYLLALRWAFGEYDGKPIRAESAEYREITYAFLGVAIHLVI